MKSRTFPSHELSDFETKGSTSTEVIRDFELRWRAKGGYNAADAKRQEGDYIESGGVHRSPCFGWWRK